MQLDGALITIERRRTTGCIDLAVVFVREHFAGVLLMTAMFAVPTVVLGWALMSYVDIFTSWMVLLLFACVSPFLGAVLVSSTGRRVFGDAFDVGEGFRSLKSRFIQLLGYVIVTRALSTILSCLILPPLLLICRYGFITEILYLENTPRKKASTRLSNLMSSVNSDMVGRGLLVFAFYAVMVFGLGILVELASNLLFGIPILWNRLTVLNGRNWELIFFDPRFCTVAHVLLWVFYPLIRLTWFFCYLDVRIQKEGWDVELDYRIEAQRLSELG